MAFAGIDVGTSGCKMVVYNLRGDILCQARRDYHEKGEYGYREIDPEEVITCVMQVIKEAASLSPETIEGLAVASLGESIVCLDRDDKSLCRSMVTGDPRGIEETKELLNYISADKIMDITGLPPSEMYSLPKFIWMKKYTDIFPRTSKVLFYEDFVGYVLTGNRKVSYSSAARSMAFDINNKCWSSFLLELAGIRVEQLSEPVPSGTIIGSIRKDIAEQLNLSPDTIVAAGGHDQTCAALGGGLAAQGVGEDGHGTCEFMFMMLPELMKNEFMRSYDLPCVPYVFPDTYLTSLEITTCGILTNWFRDAIFDGIKIRCKAEGKDFFQYMDELASSIETEVLILPQFGSSGNPHIDYDVRGTITGLTTHTKPEEIYLALKEGMTFQMLMGYEKAAELGVVLEHMILTGGGASSDLTLQMRADVFGIPASCLKSKESGTMGCMILAATAAGRYKDFKDGVEKAVKLDKTYYPRKDKEPYYKNKYNKYKKLYDLMHGFK
ncbi:FGGY family carbohydrate kinase [Blautia schinkii]|nr:FGGY family carbohydrate kinase [Blautia schinkii]